MAGIQEVIGSAHREAQAHYIKCSQLDAVFKIHILNPSLPDTNEKVHLSGL